VYHDSICTWQNNFSALAHPHKITPAMTAKTRAVHSLISASLNLTSVMTNFNSPAFNRSATFTNYIAGPLAHIISHLQPSRLAKIIFFLIKFSAMYRDQSIAHEIKTSAPSLEKFAFYESTLLMYRDLAIAQLNK
jgi:hypothetical protein